MQERGRSNAERRDETRAKLIAAARRLFAAEGFAGTGTEAIVAAAGVTRGALYFHFADKTALFAAVLDAVAREVADAIEAAGGTTALERLTRGAAAYVAAASATDARRIYLEDGRSALGHAAWAEIENRHSLPLLREGVAAALAERPGSGLDAEALTVLLNGAMVEAAARAAEADADGRARLAAALERMLRRIFGPA